MDDLNAALANAQDALEAYKTDDEALAAWVETVRDQLLTLQTFLEGCADAETPSGGSSLRSVGR
jgi:hypothetical protein